MKYGKVIVVAVLVVALVALVLFGLVPSCRPAQQGTTDNITRAATFVVAASDSSAASRTQADYVCDGVDDQIEIQAAIDALPSGGGTVLLLEGTFIISGKPSHDFCSLIVIKDYCTLSGIGWGTVLKVRDGYDGSCTAMVSNSKKDVSSTHIAIRNIRFDPNRPAVVSHLRGVVLHNTSHCVVDNCWFYNFTSHAIQFYAGTVRSIISNCFAECASAPPLYIDQAHYNTVVGNNLISHSGGICLDGANYNLIKGNVITGYGAEGISDYRGEEGGNIIEGNIITGFPYGISIRLLTEQETGGLTRHLNYEKILNNYIYSCGYGIRVEILAGHTGDYLTIQGNTIRKSSYHGIFLKNTNHNIISGNLILESSQDSDNTYDSIFLEGADYNLITNNAIHRGILTNKPRYGISISNSACNNNIVKDNDLHDAGSTANLNDAGTNTQVWGNVGYITENSGAVTIALGATYVDVTHGLAITPTVVSVTPQEAEGVDFYVDTVGATTFRIILTAAQIVDIHFYWEAKAR